MKRCRETDFVCVGIVNARKADNLQPASGACQYTTTQLNVAVGYRQ